MNIMLRLIASVLFFPVYLVACFFWLVSIEYQKIMVGVLKRWIRWRLNR
jgi:hypothetical protein